MPYRPTYPVPYLTAIDATKDNVFTCLINDKDSITSCILYILNMNNSVVATIPQSFTSPIIGGNGEDSILPVTIPANTLINGQDYKWYINLVSNKYDVQVASGNITDTTGITTTSMRIRPHLNVTTLMQMLINGQRRIINSYTISTPATPVYSTVTLDSALSATPTLNDAYSIYCNYINSEEYYFKARATPQIDIYFEGDVTPIVDGSDVNSSTQTFVGTYSQNDNINISYHKFDLYLNGNLIDTTGEVYSANISYTYDRFLSGNSYDIKLTVVTDDEVQVDISKFFDVSYDIQTVSLIPTVEVNYDKNCIDVDYSMLKVINGNLDGTAQYGVTIDGDITGTTIDYYSSIYWNEVSGVGSLNIPDDFTQYVQTKLNSMNTGIFIELENENNLMKYSIGYNGSNFYYKIGFSDTVYVPLFAPDAPVLPAVMLTSDTVNETTRYTLGGSEIWYNDTSHKFAFNDLGNTYWWKITILPDRVLFAKVNTDGSVVTIN